MTILGHVVDLSPMAQISRRPITPEVRRGRNTRLIWLTLLLVLLLQTLKSRSYLVRRFLLWTFIKSSHMFSILISYVWSCTAIFVLRHSGQCMMSVQVEYRIRIPETSSSCPHNGCDMSADLPFSPRSRRCQESDLNWTSWMESARDTSSYFLVGYHDKYVIYDIVQES